MFSRSKWTGFGLALAMLFLPVLQAQAETYFSLYDEESGRSFSFTDSNYDLRISGNRTRITFSANSNPDKPRPPEGGLWDPFDATFNAPVGEVLRPALYPDIDCTGSQRGRAAGMSVSITYPYCNVGMEIFGWYAVRQIRFDSRGRLTGLEIAFSQRAGSPTAPALSGVIRYSVGPLSLSLQSGATSRFGELQQAHFGDTSLFRLEDNGSGALRYVASVLKAEWDIHLKSTAEPLAVGRYTTHSDAGLAPVQMAVVRDAANHEKAVFCHGPGTLTVKSIKRNSAGRVIALRAAFEQYCGERPPQADTAATSMVRGEIRFRH